MFRRWQTDGCWVQLNRALVQRQHRRAAPSDGQAYTWPSWLPDSSDTARGVADKDLNGHRKLQGRKHQLVVDTGGPSLAAHVGPAHGNDRVGGKAMLEKLRQQAFKHLHLVLADADYGGQPPAK